MSRHMRQSDLLYDSNLKQFIIHLNLTVFWQNTLMHSRLPMDQPAARRAVENQPVLHEVPFTVPAPSGHCRTTAGL